MNLASQSVVLVEMSEFAIFDTNFQPESARFHWIGSRIIDGIHSSVNDGKMTDSAFKDKMLRSFSP